MKLHTVSGNAKQKFSIKKSDSYYFFLHNFSGELDVRIACEDAKVYIYGIYIGRNNEEFKLSTIQHHIKGNSISDLFVKGVFFDESKFLYDGLIKIDEDAQQSNAYQKNQNLVMSPGVYVDSRPNLEILANDVRCTHGSTTGKLDQDQLYYLENRGIARDQAESLLVEGFISDVFDRMKEQGLTESDSLRDTVMFS